MISHDSVWCWRGHMLPPAVLQMLEGGGGSMRFTRTITPMLKEAGVTTQRSKRCWWRIRKGILVWLTAEETE